MAEARQTAMDMLVAALVFCEAPLLDVAAATIACAPSPAPPTAGKGPEGADSSKDDSECEGVACSRSTAPPPVTEESGHGKPVSRSSFDDLHCFFQTVVFGVD
ncbi:hypothetical protein ACP4OV_006079 [Aristida adscensionis]